MTVVSIKKQTHARGQATALAPWIMLLGDDHLVDPVEPAAIHAAEIYTGSEFPGVDVKPVVTSCHLLVHHGRDKPSRHVVHLDLHQRRRRYRIIKRYLFCCRVGIGIQRIGDHPWLFELLFDADLNTIAVDLVGPAAAIILDHQTKGIGRAGIRV